MATLKDAQSFSEGRAKLYAVVTVTDSFHGNPRFNWSDAHFGITTNPLGEPTSAVIQSWGAIGKAMDGPIQEAGKATLTLFADESCVPGNSTEEFTVIEWMNRLQFLEAPISIYQWNEFGATQDLIWSGYISDIDNQRWEEGVMVVDLFLVSSLKELDQEAVSDVITREASSFPNAPRTSEGLMVPIAYGDLDGILMAGLNRNSLGVMAFPMPGIRGVVVDENQSNAKVKMRFAKNDGTSAAHTVAAPTAGDPRTVGDLWIYDEGMQAYGMVDGGSYTLTNSTTVLECVIDAAPKVYFYLKPSLRGSKTAAGFTDLDKLIDMDPTNYIESTSTDYAWAFDCPVAHFSGKVRSVSCVVMWRNSHGTKQRKVRFGLWDVYANGGANWLKPTALHEETQSPGGPFIHYQDAGGASYSPYVATDFRGNAGAGTHLGSSTFAEMASGRFITRDSGDVNEANLQIAVEVGELGGANSGRDGVRVYGIMLCIEVDYPWVPRHNSHSWLGPGWRSYYAGRAPKAKRVSIRSVLSGLNSYTEFLDRLQEQNPGMPAEQAREQAMERLVGTNFFIRGKMQKDDGSGTYTGTAGAVITKPVSVLHHLLHKRMGKAVNVTAGTLGNFIDPRTGGVGGQFSGDLDSSSIAFGPEVVTAFEAVEVIESRLPFRVFEEDGTFNVIPDDMNPHSSRVYRSTSDVVSIKPGDFDPASFKVQRLPFEKLYNRSVLQFAHGFPDREANGAWIADNPMSQDYYGVRPYHKPIEEPFITLDVFGATSTQAETFSHWLRWRQARPRLIIPGLRLSHAFYDLKRGHVVQFENLEDMGIRCSAHRCGLIDYYHNNSGVNRATALAAANSSSFNLIALTTSEIYMLLQQQTDRITFGVGVAAAYTTLANSWEYWNGTGWSAFGDANTTNKDGLKSTGTQTISWVRPRFDLWMKTELILGSTRVGPGYALRMKYQSGTATGTGNARVSYPAVWSGRIFEVTDVRRSPLRSKSGYHSVEASFMEVM